MPLLLECFLVEEQPSMSYTETSVLSSEEPNRFSLSCVLVLMWLFQFLRVAGSNSPWPMRGIWLLLGALSLVLDSPGSLLPSLAPTPALDVPQTFTQCPATVHRNPKENSIYYSFSSIELSKLSKKTWSPGNKGLNKCITNTNNNYQETHSGKEHGETVTPKNLRCMNLDRLNNLLILT